VRQAVQDNPVPNSESIASARTALEIELDAGTSETAGASTQVCDGFEASSSARAMASAERLDRP
jgi:hypothetical protein